MSASLYDLLKYAHTGIAAPSMSAFDKARALAMSGSGGGGEQWPANSIDGLSPLSFYSDGYPLDGYVIDGDLVQTGTPTPDSPIYPQEVGDLVLSGEHEGKYAVPITVGGKTYTIYLTEPLRYIYGWADEITYMNTMTSHEICVWRTVKKIVLTGDEDYLRYSADNPRCYIEISGANFTNGAITVCCSHYQARANGGLSTVVSYPSGSIAWRTALNQLTIIDSSITSIDEFRTFLSEQYAAGTPVCIWYTLSSDESEDMELPVIIPKYGLNTLSVNTTLACSAIGIHGGINPV